MDVNSGVTLYDYNKELSKQVDTPLDPIILNQKLAEIARTFKKSSYLMLLCHEDRNYTIFNMKEASTPLALVDDLRETLLNRGSVVSIDKDSQGGYEIWIRGYDDYCYYIFDYSQAVIEVH